jgi:galactokinase
VNGGLDCLVNRGAVRARLEACGLSAASAEAKATLLARCVETLAAGGAAKDAAARAFFVPGRIEVLGKHTDYAGGRSLIAAAEQGICLVAVPREDAVIRATALDMQVPSQSEPSRGGSPDPPRERCGYGPDSAAGAAGQETRRAELRCNGGHPSLVEFTISPDLSPPAGHWSNYLMTVARRLAKNFFGNLRGADIAFAGDLPVAAGMSSSSALVVACFLALAAVNRLREREEFHGNIATAEDLAEYLGAVENGQTFRRLVGDMGVGTFGGSEDHTAMFCSEAGMLAQYSYYPTRLERRLPMPAGHVFAIASSGIAAEKTGAAMEKYNHASRLAAEVARVWRGATGRGDPHIAAALASADTAISAERMRAALAGYVSNGGQAKGAVPFSRLCEKGTVPFATPEKGTAPVSQQPETGAAPFSLLARFEHFFNESAQIVPSAGDALAAGDLAALGRLVDLSQKLAEGYLGNQVPETVYLARIARELGAAAASSFGAGFGGSVWALVRRDRAERFLADWAARYREAFPSRAADATFFLSCAGPAAVELGI